MGQIKNLTGNRYGGLIVLSLIDTGRKGSRWLCQCDCGRTSIVHSQALRRGMTKTCGACPNPNAMVLDGDVVHMLMSSGDWFHIDKVDYPLIEPYRWCKDGRGYVVARINGVAEKLHRFLLGAPSEFEVDHIDLNPLNNIRANLRLATRQQNSFNISPKKNNNTGFVGVSFDRTTNSYTASVMLNGKKYWGGRHATPIEAAKARDSLAKCLHKDFAYLNF